jgi:hypothetical protein
LRQPTSQSYWNSYKTTCEEHDIGLEAKQYTARSPETMVKLSQISR